MEYGRPYHYGLEAGSKPELLAVMAMLEDEEALIICNGYKDEEYIETALLASKLGRHVILVVEKPSELPLIRGSREKMGVRPRIGIRSRLSATRGRALGGLGRRPVEVRPLRRATCWTPWPSCASTTCSTRSSCSTSTSAARSPPSARSRTACARRPRSTSNLVADGRAARLPGRGRRPGGGLRRLADELHLVAQLHAPGVRQRHRLRRHGGVRRQGRAAPDDRLRVGPGHRGPPRGADHRRAGRLRVRGRQAAEEAAGGRRAVAQEPVRDLP